MEDKLYIVLWADKYGNAWRPQPGGVFTERRLAENLIECLKASGERWDFVIVEGPITSPKQMEEQETALGSF